LQDAAKDKDNAELRRICHNISGTSLSICANDIAEAAQEIGRLLREGKVEKVDDALAALERNLEIISIWGKENGYI